MYAEFDLFFFNSDRKGDGIEDEDGKQAAPLPSGNAFSDRLYNGGTVCNYKIPKTGDRSELPLWIGMALMGVGILGWVLVIRRKVF